MAVVPMKRIFVAAMRKDRKKILEYLQQQGAVELQSTVPEDDVFKKQDMTTARGTFLRNRQIAENALKILDAHAPEQKGLLASLEGRTVITAKEYGERQKKRIPTMEKCQEILDYEKEWAEQKNAVPKTELDLIALEPWLGYDLPLNVKGTRSTAIFAGILPGAMTLEEILQKLSELAPDVEDADITVLSSSKEQTAVFAVCGKKSADLFREALRKMEFAAAPDTALNPSEEKKALEQQLEQQKKTIDIMHEKIAGEACWREDIKFLIDDLTLRADKYELIGTLAQTGRVFLLEGYAPEQVCGRLEQRLTQDYGVVFEASDPEENEDSPVLLKNNAFAAPLEGVIESYSLPGKKEFDPTFLTSLFYYAMFGIMLSDAAYGILMALACAVVLCKFKNMEDSMKRSLRLFLYCGIATMIAGFMFGSFFGDAVNVIASTFFGKPEVALKPIWFEPINDPIRMLTFCFLVGLIHLFTGLGAKFYSCVKNGQIRDAIYDVVFWYMLLGGAIVYLLSMSMFTEMLGLSFQVSAGAAKAAAVVALVGVIGIILTAGRESRSWFKRLLKGVYGVYGITSYLSDVLSYSRLLALGLATSVISSLFNKMGSMFGGGLFGAIMFVIVFLIGHVLNIAINALGAYVHTNRLQYVEFFGKFYDGGGRKFRPFMANTKYFKFKEDI